MKSLRALLTVVGVMCLAANLSAEEKRAGPAEGLQDLPLTEDQEAKIAKIRKESHPEVQKASKSLDAIVKEQMEKIEAVLTPEQKKTLEVLKAERKRLPGERLVEQFARLHALELTDAERAKILAIRKEYQPKVVKAMEGLHAILSDEQKKAREEGHKAGKKREEVISALKLTDKQKVKVEAVGKEVHEIVREELGKIKEVLTESQKAVVQEFKGERSEHVRDWLAHRVANFKDLDDEAKSKIAAIRKEYAPKVHEAGNTLRAAIRDEVHKIHAALSE
jgi:Spy/CpxP family protein refolding chaperone